MSSRAINKSNNLSKLHENWYAARRINDKEAEKQGAWSNKHIRSFKTFAHDNFNCEFINNSYQIKES